MDYTPFYYPFYTSAFVNTYNDTDKALLQSAKNGDLKMVMYYVSEGANLNYIENGDILVNNLFTEEQKKKC
jgi:hypothetical protein